MSQQRVDDVTGDPIRLSAKQREQQRAETVHQVNQIILQLNAVTMAVRQLQEKAVRLDVPEGAPFSSIAELGALSFRRRLRWLVLGR